MMNNEWLMVIIVLGSVGALIYVPRFYCAITRRSPWSPALLQRVDSTLARWTNVLTHDWAMLLGRIREMSQNAVGESGAAQRFVLGSISLLVGPVVGVLNAVILAQILEIFLPGSTETLAIPYLGEFMPFPFIAAIIIALVEVIAAIAIWHAPHLAWRLFAGLVALVAVSAETAGGYIRARVLEGADDVTRAGGAGLLGMQTAGVSALISFLAPTAEMIAGALLFEGILAPLSYHGLRLARIIPLWLLRGAGNIVYGPFLREPYLSEPVVAPADDAEQEMVLEETPQPDPILQASILEADLRAQNLLDEAVAINTESHVLAVATIGLLGSIDGFIATKVKHGPRHTIEVHPSNIIAEFNKTLAEARNQTVFHDCQAIARDSNRRHPARVYAG